jgi:adenylate cyclase
VIALVIIFILISTLGSDLTASLETGFIRTAVRLNAIFRKPSSEVLIATVKKNDSEKGLEWNQRTFLSLIDKLNEYNAKLVIIAAAKDDFTGPTFSKRTASDLPIVMAYNFYPTLSAMPPRTEGEGVGTRRKQSKKIEIMGYPSKPLDDSKLLGMAGIDDQTITNSKMNLVGQGFLNIFPNSRGLVINQPLAVRFRGSAYPALSIVAYSKWLGFTPILKESPKGSPIGVSVGGKHISTGPNTKITINYLGKSGTFPSIDLEEILTGDPPPETITGKIIIVSAGGSNMNDIYLTPVGSMNNAEIQANILDNLLRNRVLKSFVGWHFAAPVFIVIGALFFFLLLNIPFKKRVSICFGIIAGVWIAGLFLFYTFNLWIPVIQTTILAGSLLLFLFIWKLFGKDLPRFKLTQLFSWRLPRSSIEMLVEDRSLINSAGREREVTALALDIKGFGHISDKLSPKDFIKFLVQFRILISNTLIRHGAMIDSWSGDDCKAIFGAPVAIAEPTLSACIAALDLRRTLIAHQSSWKKHFDLDRLRLGIGIHKGKAVTGDFGLGFNIIGGVVEAAKQLKRLNRFYKTWMLVGNPVVEETQSAVEYRPLDPVHLWGETSPTVIHEVIGEIGTILPSLKAYEEARSAYLRGDFKMAADLFRRILSSHPNDGPSRLFLKRSMILIQESPKAWDGVWKAS